MTLPMDSSQKLIERLVERRMQNTGESQAVATAKVLAAFEAQERGLGLYVAHAQAQICKVAALGL